MTTRSQMQSQCDEVLEKEIEQEVFDLARAEDEAPECAAGLPLSEVLSSVGFEEGQETGEGSEDGGSRESQEPEDPAGAPRALFSPARGAWGGAGLVVVAGASTVLAAFAWAYAAGRLGAPGYGPIVFPAGILLLGCLCGMVIRAGRRGARQRLEQLASAFQRLVRGEDPHVDDVDPLAGALQEAEQRIADRIEARLRLQDETLHREFRHDLVSTRSQCERLVERHAEQAVAARKKAERELDELRRELQEKEAAWQEERRNVQERLRGARETARDLGRRTSDLEMNLVEREADKAGLELELKRLRAENETLRSQRVQFFDRIAAQLRGPLQIVDKLAAELAGAETSDGAPRKAAKEAAAEIRRRVADQEHLIDSLIQLSRVESSSVSVVFSELKVSRLVKRSVERVAARAAEKNIKVSSKVPRSLPAVLTDVRLAARMLSELLSNAVQYTPASGRVTVTASLQTGGDDASGTQRGDCLSLEVRDTGPGIPREERERIFNAFQHGTAPRFTMVDGSAGLGLTLARSYARLLGGEISVEDNDGKGSAFRIVLPVKPCKKIKY